MDADPRAHLLPRQPQHLTCDLCLTTLGRELNFKKLDVSASGIARLPDNRMLGELAAGQKAQVCITLPGGAGTASTVTIQGRITRESSLEESCYGLAFDWFEQESARLILCQALTDQGHAAEPNRRKHERTKALATNPIVPTVAQLRLSDGSAFELTRPDAPPLWSARILNLSPGGLLISTESPEAALVKPGDGLCIFIQPRDTQGFMIESLGEVRRVLEHVERTAAGEVLVRSLGIRFEWIDEDQRTIYLSLLKCLASGAPRL